MILCAFRAQKEKNGGRWFANYKAEKACRLSVSATWTEVTTAFQQQLLL